MTLTFQINVPYFTPTMYVIQYIISLPMQKYSQHAIYVVIIIS